ncbi:uncharacterized protein [Apostichopus japonicus]|uniref:uncharacterized protein isoform X2 n=1 Tax=Stichopus japonicus TaxID=307972 RepID=UPI003AB56BC1
METMADDEFKVDVIQCSIVDLQKEKEQNERMLYDAQKKRINLEKKCENVSQKFNQLGEKHSKMQETVKVAQYKVSQSQTQINSQQAVNKEKQDRINELMQVIGREKDGHQRDLEVFQEQLSELTNQFRNARHFYTDESLQLETSMLEKKVKEFKAKVLSARVEVGNLKQKLSDLEIQLANKEKLSTSGDVFTSEEKDNILTTMDTQGTQKTFEE